MATLRAAGCVFAEEEARLLAAQAREVEELDRMVALRVGGQPLEQVLGWAQFCGLRVEVAPGVFVPRRRTELLAHTAVRIARGLAAPVVALDLCCGSGAVAAVLAAQVSSVELHASDIDPVAVACARRNLPGAALYQGDAYAGLGGGLLSRVDVLVANAPYVPSDQIRLLPAEARDHEPIHALDGGADGLDVQRQIVRAAPSWLSSRGALLVETSLGQAAATAQVVAAVGLLPEVIVSDRLSVAVVLARRPTVASPR